MTLFVSDSIIQRERVSMKLYESVSILRSAQEEAVNDQVVEKMKGILTQSGANILKLDNSGKKKLAYDIHHEQKGTFITVQFEGPSTVVAELERFQRMEDQVMKFLTVRVNPADLLAAAEAAEAAESAETDGEEAVDGVVQ